MTWLLLLLACGDADTQQGLADRDGDGFPASEDCDDDDRRVHPGAPDAWYDGVDSDCDGRDDYDQDEDGARWTAHGGGDCDDTDPTIGPDQPEVPYDFVDNDCDPLTPENDLDGDGSVFPIDCDDQDPTIGEGFPERFGDGVDEDCDGHVDGTSLQPYPLQLSGPHHLRAITDRNGEPMVVLAADQVVGHADDGRTDAQVGLALWPTMGAPPLQVHGGLGSAEPIGGIDVALAGDVTWFAVSYRTAATGIRRLALHHFEEVAGTMVRFYLRTLDAEPGPAPPVVELTVDRGGEPWAAMGDEDLVAWLGGSAAAGGSAEADASVGLVFEDAVPPLPFTSCAPTGCTAWATSEVDAPPTPLTDGPSVDGTGRTLVDAGGMTLLTDRSLAAIGWVDDQPYVLFPSWPLVQASGWTHAGVLYAAGITTDDQVVVTWGNPDFAAMSETVFTVPADWVPREAVIWVDDDRVFVGVAATYVLVEEELEDRLFYGVLERVRL